MSWILLALFAGISSNISNFFSRTLLKNGEHTTIYAWFFEAVRVVFFGILVFFDSHFIFTISNVLFLLSIGFVECIAVYVYMKMHAYSRLSISTIASRTRLIWIPLMAFLFVHEHLSITTYAGIGILFLGLVTATAPHKLFFDKGLWFAYLSAFVISITTVQTKLALPFASPSLIILAIALPATIIFPFFIKQPKKTFTHFFKDRFGIKLLAGLVNILAIYFFTLAAKEGPVSLVNALYQGTLVVAVLAGIFILGEREDMQRKLIGTAITVIGVILLS